jgi:fused signal recognition particle receptor
MFNFLKEKLKSAFSKITRIADKKADEEKEKLAEELKEVHKEEIKIEEKKLDMKKEERAVEKELKTVKDDKKEIKQEIKEEIKEIKKEERAVEKEKEEVKTEKKGIFQKIKEQFTTTKISEGDFEEIFGQLELVLLENNIALEVVDKLKEDMKYRIIDKTIKRKELETEVKNALRDTLKSIIKKPFNFIDKINSGKKPFVIAFFGINGSGKTTTIAKIADLLKKNKLKSVLAAADTFRAASIEQLEKHGTKLGIEVIKHQYGADPAAVAFDAIKHATARNLDVVLIDTAGRMHTKTDLMKEMEKIIRVAKPDMKILVTEAIIGNDAVEQGKAFNEIVGIDGIILTKSEIDEKGGASISMNFVTGKPILFLGTGQEYDKLKVFDPEELIKNVLG